jgi:hypothetical protein
VIRLIQAAIIACLDVNVFGSNLKVTGDLNISADNINIQGSKVVANNAIIKSDNLNIAAVQDSKATQMKSSAKGLLS